MMISVAVVVIIMSKSSEVRHSVGFLILICGCGISFILNYLRLVIHVDVCKRFQDFRLEGILYLAPLNFRIYDLGRV